MGDACEMIISALIPVQDQDAHLTVGPKLHLSSYTVSVHGLHPSVGRKFGFDVHM